MSIIHDALKKIQNNQKINTQSKEPDPNPPAVNPSAPKSEYNTQNMENIYEKLHKKPEPAAAGNSAASSVKTSTKKATKKSEQQENPIKSFFTIMFCLIVIAGALWFIYQYYTLNMEKKGVNLKKVFNIKPSSLNLNIAPKPRHTSAPKQTAMKPEDYPTDAIVLNGVTTMGDTRVALINNEIYRLGESIKGKTIINITMEKVELEDSNGNVTTLRVKGY